MEGIKVLHFFFFFLGGGGVLGLAQGLLPFVDSENTLKLT